MVDLTFEELSADCISAAKDAILDQLGIMLAGSTFGWTQPSYEVVRAMGSQPTCTIVGKAEHAAAPDAAFVNATFGHSCELDDSGYQNGAHPGALTVPAAFAMAEARGKSGPDVLLAVVAGYDVISMIGRVATRPILERGFHHQGVLGPFGAAVTAGKLIGLDHSQMINALSIAGSHSSGTMEYDQHGGEVKRIHSAIPVRGGIVAALLAEQGLTGPCTILEGLRGVPRLFGGVDDVDGVAEPIGPPRWHAIEGRIVKAFPALGTLHTSIQAVDKIMRDSRPRTDDIDGIDVYVSELTLSHGGGIADPEDTIGAQFSMSFSLALRLLYGRNELSDYMNSRLWGDEAMKQLGYRVRLHADPGMTGDTWWGSRVVMTLADGTQREATELYRKGAPQNPLTGDELRAKFRSLASYAISECQAQKIIDIVTRLDEVDDIRELTTQLALGGEIVQ